MLEVYCQVLTKEILTDLLVLSCLISLPAFVFSSCFFFQVSLSTWEDGNAQPTLDYSVLVNPSAALSRNPFSEKKWRKFQIKRLFNSSNAATKMHAIDVHVIESGASYVDKWFVALSLGSGQTRNMALDRYAFSFSS